MYSRNVTTFQNNKAFSQTFTQQQVICRTECQTTDCCDLAGEGLQRKIQIFHLQKENLRVIIQSCIVKKKKHLCAGSILGLKQSRSPMRRQTVQEVRLTKGICQCFPQSSTHRQVDLRKRPAGKRAKRRKRSLSVTEQEPLRNPGMQTV